MGNELFERGGYECAAGWLSTIEFRRNLSVTANHNLRSRAVVERIGMQIAQQKFEHPALVDGHPLRLHCPYRVSREQWSTFAA